MPSGVGVGGPGSEGLVGGGGVVAGVDTTVVGIEGQGGGVAVADGQRRGRLGGLSSQYLKYILPTLTLLLRR